MSTTDHDLTGPAPAEPTEPVLSGAGRHGSLALLTGGRLVLALLALAAAATAVAAAGAHVALVTPILGLVAVIAVPAGLLYINLHQYLPEGAGGRLLTIPLTLLMLMLVGLALNTFLPLVGDSTPLGTTGVLCATDGLIFVLAVAALRYRAVVFSVPLPPAASTSRLVLGGSLAVVGLAVVGSIRLDNGAGGGVALGALIAEAALFVLIVARRDDLPSGVIHAALYAIALALLFSTSLRGWYTTGHDVRLEMFVFRLTATNQHWSIAQFRDPYNACLSLTILPTMILRWTGVAAPFVFKVFFQVLFAACPVLVYRFARVFFSKLIALLSFIYVVGFVTFFQDMPMLNRQEMGYLFFAGILVVIADPRLSPNLRRVWFVVLSVGMVLSHYSTTFFAIGVLAVAWCIGAVLPFVSRLRLFTRLRTGIPQLVESPRRLTIGPVLALVLVSFLWTTPLTHTSSSVGSDFTAVVDALRGGPGGRASDTSFALVPLGSTSASQAAVDLVMKDTNAARAAHPDSYYALGSGISVAPNLAASSTLPLTSLGRFASKEGVDVHEVTAAVRRWSALLLQLFIVLGLAGFVLLRRGEGTRSRDLAALGLAALVGLALQVLVPALSVQYGVARALEQSLLIVSPFWVLGTMLLIPARFGRLRATVATVLALAFFISSTGVLPQVLGAYGPQLNLNNSGDYYDEYYLHNQDVATVSWLQRAVYDGSSTTTSDVQMDPTLLAMARTFTNLNATNNVYPALVQRNAYVVLSYENVVLDRANYDTGSGYLVYNYPLGAMDQLKNLVYSTGATRVYR
jgi:uncharacterized membrane protein